MSELDSKLYSASLVNAPLLADSADEAIYEVNQSDTLVFITYKSSVATLLTKYHCNLTAVWDDSFPMKQGGFFYSNTTPEWFEIDIDRMIRLHALYKYLMGVYQRPIENEAACPTFG